MGNIVAIVGRPNVGKSTLFNRLTGTRQAIVNEEAGTTRDRQYGKVEWTGKEFSLIDTGGWVVNSEDVFEEEINKQVKVAIEEADVILFVVDVLNGITDLDMEVAQILRRCKRPVIVVANKADNYELHPASAEFYSFGLGDPFCISAINGSYTGDLLDKIVATLPEEKVEILEEELPRIAIIGRPNAGKSSLINAFIDFRNFVRISRLKMSYHTSEDYTRSMLLPYGRLSKAQINSLLECESSNELMNNLKATYIGKSLNKAEYNTQSQMITALNSIYCKKNIRLSVNASVVMLSYVMLSEIELSNIINLIEGTRYGFSEEEKSRLLVR